MSSNFDPDDKNLDPNQSLNPSIDGYSMITQADDSITESSINKPLSKDNTNLSGMAELIGFNYHPDIADVTHGMMGADQAESERTPLPPYANPLIKFPLLICAVGLVASIVGVVFLGGGEEPDPVVKTETTPVATTSVFEDTSDGKAKADLALGKELNKEMFNKKAASVPETPVGIPPNPIKQSKPPVAIVTPPVTIASNPSPTKAPEPLAVKPAPSFSYPIVKPIPIFDQLKQVKTPSISNVVKPKIFKPIPKPQIKKFTNAIAYSQSPAPRYQPIVSPPPSPVNILEQSEPLTWEKISATNASFGGEQPNANELKNPYATPQASDSPKKVAINSLGEAGVLSGTVPKVAGAIIPVGRSVSGVLVSPIQMLAGKENEVLATIQLNQPLMASNGHTLMLPGAQITFKLTIHDDNGYLSGTAIQASIRGNIVEIPPNSISIQSNENRPLVAQNYQFGTSQIRDRDALNFLYSAAANVGAILTAPTQQNSTTNNSNGSSSSSSLSTSNPSILGAILQGGFNPLATAIQTRNTTEIEKILAGTRLWQLPVGTPVKVNVISQFSL